MRPVDHDEVARIPCPDLIASIPRSCQTIFDPRYPRPPHFALSFRREPSRIGRGRRLRPLTSSPTRFTAKAVEDPYRGLEI